MKATIYISGIIGKETSLVDVIRQFKAHEDPSEVDVVIHSEGGNVEEGDGIYNYLKTLDLTIPVTTITDKAYSIAAKIFTAGRTRIVEDAENAIMIHFAWGKAEGNADKFEAVAETLRELEEEFATFYSEFLNIDKETVEGLLDNNTFLSGAEAVDFGFATEVKEPSEAVALSTIKQLNLKGDKMTKIKKSKGQVLLAAMAAFVGIEDNEINALMLQDSNGTEINFPDLEDDATPKEGDKAEIDGSAIEDGEYIIPSMEDATVVFVGGAVTEIKPKEVEDAKETDEEIEAKKKLAKEEEEEEEAIEAMLLKVENKIEAKYKKQTEAIQAELESVKKLLGSKDFSPEARENNKNKNKVEGNSLSGIFRNAKKN